MLADAKCPAVIDCHHGVTADGSPKPIGMLHATPASQPLGSVQPSHNSQNATRPLLGLPQSPTHRTPCLQSTPGTGTSHSGPAPSQPASSHQSAGQRKPLGETQLSVIEMHRSIIPGAPQLDQADLSQRDRRPDESVMGSCGPHFSQIHQQSSLNCAASSQPQQLQGKGGVKDSTWAWDSPTQQRRAPTSNCSGTFQVAGGAISGHRAQGNGRAGTVQEVHAASCISESRAVTQSGVGADLAAEQSEELAPIQSGHAPPNRSMLQDTGPSRKFQQTLSMQTQPDDGGPARLSGRRKHAPQAAGPARPKSAKLAGTARARVAAPARPGSARPASMPPRSTRSPGRQAYAPGLCPCCISGSSRSHSAHKWWSQQAGWSS